MASDIGKSYRVERICMCPHPESEWMARVGQIGVVTKVSPSTLNREYDGLTLRFEDGAEVMFAREELQSMRQ